MNEFEKKSIVGVVDEITWGSKNTVITITGYAYVKGLNLAKNSSVKKSLVVFLGDKKFYIPLNNEIRHDLIDNIDGFNYQYAGFKGSIDLGYINEMDSLSPGDWGLNINIIVDDLEEEVPLLYKGVLDEITPKIVFNKENNAYIKLQPFMLNEKFYIKSLLEEANLDLKKESFKDSLKKRVKPIFNYINNKKLKVVSWLYNKFKTMPINYNRVLFLSDSRANMDGNFEFVYKELVSRGGFEIKSILKPSVNSKLNLIEKIKFLYYVATTKYILLDDFYPKIYGFKLRDEIELIQLWHACGAFKTFGFSRLGKVGGPRLRSKNHRNYTKAIVSSESIRKHYAEGFGISIDKVIATGVPRTDIFFDKEYAKNISEKIYEKYPLIKNKKVIMFAPTFRGNGQQTAYYDFDKVDLDKLYNNLSDEYVIIMKLHPFIKNVPEIDAKYSNFIIDLSSEREINDLLFVSDILITDYSSVCFEFSLLNRPMIFFAYDMEEYISSRDFYYPYESFVPGNIVKTTEGIIDIIKNNKFNLDKLESFRNRFFSHLDGKSTERVVNMMLKSNEKNKQ